MSRLSEFLIVKQTPEITNLPLRERQLLSAMHEQQLIGEYSPDYWLSEAWVLKMTLWCTLLGLRNEALPEKEELLFLEEALQNDFKAHSFAEIEVALKMCVMDEFPEPIEAYNKLNLRFLAKVMKAYRKFRKDTANKYEEIKFKLQKAEPLPPSKFSLDIAIANEIWEDYLRTVNNIDIYAATYKAELLQRIGIVSSEEINTGIEKIVIQILDDYNKTKSEITKKRLHGLVCNEKNLYIHADRVHKERVYTLWLNHLMASKTSFVDFCDLVEGPVFNLHGELYTPRDRESPLPPAIIPE